MKKKAESVVFNHRGSRKLLKIVCCLDFVNGSKMVRIFNYVYIGLVCSLLIIVITQGVILGCTAKQTAVKVEAIHYTLVIIIILAYISNELYNHSRLSKAWALLMFAYNHFNGDTISDEQKEFHRSNAKIAQGWNYLFSVLMSAASLAYLFFTPIREALLQDPQAPKSLPIPMYMPFEASHNPGYWLAILWEGITLLFLCGVATSTHLSYIGYMGALRAEFRLLNYSISSLEKRAAKRFGITDVTLDTYKDQQFQSCLYMCIREDIIHHQLLVQYYKLIKDYLGFILLIYIVVSSIILAAAGYLISRPNSPTEETIKFVVIVCSELWYIFCLCWFGEKVSEESNKTFRKLFEGSWYTCNKKFNVALSIMLYGTLNPIRLKTNLFSITASLETYNSVVMTSFQYFNVLRNFQTM